MNSVPYSKSFFALIFCLVVSPPILAYPTESIVFFPAGTTTDVGPEDVNSPIFRTIGVLQAQSETATQQTTIYYPGPNARAEVEARRASTDTAATMALSSVSKKNKVSSTGVGAKTAHLEMRKSVADIFAPVTIYYKIYQRSTTTLPAKQQRIVSPAPQKITEKVKQAKSPYVEKVSTAATPGRTAPSKPVAGRPDRSSADGLTFNRGPSASGNEHETDRTSGKARAESLNASSATTSNSVVASEPDVGAPAPSDGKATEATDSTGEARVGAQIRSLTANRGSIAASAPVGTLPDADQLSAEVERLSGNAIAINNLGVRLALASRYEEALGIVLKAISIRSDIPKFHQNLSILYENLKRFDEAHAAAQRAADLAPRETSALIQLCGLEVLRGFNEKGIECFEKLEEMGPLDKMSQAFYGVALFNVGKVDPSIAILEKAITGPMPSAETLNALGVAYFSNKDYERAIRVFKQAIETSPHLGKVRFNLAIAQLADRNKEGALSQYRLLKEQNPKLAADLYRAIHADKIVYVGETER